MRQTFTLLIELREDIQGDEQRKVTEQIQAYAAKQDIQTFSFESGDPGIYAFMAHPDYIDEQKDSYKMGVFRDTLDSWLMHHQDIDSFTLQPMTELSELLPRIGDSPVQPVTDNLDSRDKPFRTNN